MDWTLALALVAQLVLASQAQISDLWPNVPGQNTPCPSEGHFPHPNYCDRFYRCLLVTGSRKKIYQVVHFVCRDGLAFEPEKEECVEPSESSRECSGNRITTLGPDSGSQIGSSTPRPDGSTTAAPVPSTSVKPSPTQPGQGGSTTTAKPDGGDGKPATNQTNLHCSKEGFFRNPENCHKFYRCVDLYGKNNSFTIFEFDCPGGLVFDEAKETCNWPDAVDVPCGETPSSTVSPKGGETTTEKKDAESGKQKEKTENGGKGGSKGDGSENGGNGGGKGDGSENGGNGGGKGDGSSENGGKGGSSQTPCTKEGFFRNPKDCGKFYRCVNIGGNDTKLIAYQFNCSKGLVWDEALTTCNYPEMTAPPCGTSTGETSPPPKPVGPKPQYDCKDEGFYRNPKNCSQFFRCVKDNSTDSYLVYKFNCPAGLVFDEDNVTCNWPDAAKPCDQNGGGGASSTVSPTVAPQGTGAPQTEAPKTEAPKTEAPATEAPKTEAPKTEAPKTEAPATESPKTDAPKTEAPATEGPKTQTPCPTQATSKPEATTAKPSGGDGSSNLKCPKEGFFRNPQNCNKFYRCVDFSGKKEEYTIYHFDCPKGLVFDESELICNWPDKVPACQDASTGEPQGDVTTTPAPSMKPTAAVRRKSSPNGKKGQKTGPEQRDQVKPLIQCKKVGYYRHPLNCNKFVQCSKSRNGQFMNRELTCPPGLVFDEASRICTWPENTTPCYPYSRRFLEAPFPLQGISRRKRSANHTTFVAGPFSSLIGTYLVRYGRAENALTCPAEGVYPHPNNCHQFYKCVDFSNTGKQFVLFLFVCSDGLAYDGSSKQCVPEETTNSCIEKAGTTTASPTDQGERESFSTPAGEQSTEGREEEDSNEILPTQNPEISGDQSKTTQRIEETTTQIASETTTGGIDVTTSSSSFKCTKEGFYRDPEDCNKFYRCVDYFGDGKRLSKYSFRCGEGLVFDEALSTCNWPDQATPPCGSTPGATTAAGTEQPGSTEGPGVTDGSASTIEGSDSTTESSISTDMTTTTSDGAIVESTEFSTTVEGGENQEISTTTIPSSQSTTEAPSDKIPLTCKSAGFYRNPNNCSKFYRCVDFYGNKNYTIFQFDCPDGLVFDETVSVCNWPDQAPPCESDGEVTISPIETTTASASTGSPADEASTIGDSETTTDEAGSRQSRRENVYDCSKEGNFPFEADCERFYNCEPDETGKLIGTLLKCPEGFVFESSIQKCIREPEDFECNVQPPNDKIFCTNSTIVDNAPIAGGDFLDI